MPKDRRHDRHTRPARIIRPDPPELWDRLGDAVGDRGRSEVISLLIAHYLGEGPMPPKPTSPRA